tara:strand:+ start:7927 stop:8376 length:450 start_codon:yes stop_codon:yes gene_type:complete
MDVILLERVGKLGNIGDKINVKAGYGRNYLIPNGKAVFATADNMASFEARRSELEATAAALLAEAQARATQLEALGLIIIAANAGDEGKLFGSIGTRDIADMVTAAGVEIEKIEVKLPEGAIREIGEFDIDIQVHAEITQVIKLSVVAE